MVKYETPLETLARALGVESYYEDPSFEELCEGVKDLVALRNEQEIVDRKHRQINESAQKLWRALGQGESWELEPLLSKLERVAQTEFARKEIRKTAKGRDLVMSDEEVERAHICVQEVQLQELRDKVAQLEAELVVAQDSKKEALDNMNTVVSSLRKVSAELIVERGRTLRSQTTAGLGPRGVGCFSPLTDDDKSK